MDAIPKLPQEVRLAASFSRQTLLLYHFALISVRPTTFGMPELSMEGNVGVEWNLELEQNSQRIRGLVMCLVKVIKGHIVEGY